MSCLRLSAALAMGVLLHAASARAQSSSTEVWRWTFDPAAPGAETAADATRPLSEMAPGWHITTRPAATLWAPGNYARGRYSVETELHLFPESDSSGLGIFVGGRDLDSRGASSLAFLVRRDGQVAIERHVAGRPVSLVAWSPAAGLAPHAGKEPERHVLRVSVGPDSLRFDVDGRRAAAAARGALVTDGLFGFRVGTRMNVHVTRLDLIQHLAPAGAHR